MFRIFLRCFAAYILFLAVMFGFSLAATAFEPVARLEQRIFKPKLGLILNGEVHLEDIRIGGKQLAFDDFFSSQPAGNQSEVSWWVLPLDGEATESEIKIAEQLDVSGEKIVNLQNGGSVRSVSVSLIMRPHFIPFYVDRTTVVVFDLQFIAKTYRKECHAEVFESYAMARQDTELRNRCKIGADRG